MSVVGNSVFMIGWEYPPHNSGGLGVACQGMTEALAEQNIQIYFTLPHKQFGSVSHMSILECADPAWFAAGTISTHPPFLAYTADKRTPQSLGEVVFDRHNLNALPQSELESKVDRYAELVTQKGKALQQQYDVIHAHDWMSFPAAMSLADATKKPFIAHVHSTEMDRIPSGYGSDYIMSTEYQGMMAADRVIAVSYYTKQLLVHKYRIDPNKIYVVHNGINPLLVAPDAGRHHFASQRPVIVFMGRLTMQKGADYFLQLARAVLAEIPEALFVVAGSGDMYHQLLLQNAGQGLSANVLFSGFVRDTQQQILLDRADLFVMPSVSEPFGLVALEAAQRKTPVIVSSNSGVSEVLPNSVVADFWDIDKMKSEIIRLLTKPDEYQSTVNQQLADLKPLTWASTAQKIRAVYAKTGQK